jgi:hypothetical protein
MKELIKPSANESKLNEVTELCETHCDPPAPCNRYCSGGATNKSANDEDDIIF